MLPDTSARDQTVNADRRDEPLTTNIYALDKGYEPTYHCSLNDIMSTDAFFSVSHIFY